MILSELIFHMMREKRRYSLKFISKRNNIPLSSVRKAMASLVRGGVVEKLRSPADRRVFLYETRQKDIFRLFNE